MLNYVQLKNTVSGSTFLPSVGQSKLKRIRLSDLFEQIKFTLSYFKQHCTLQNCHNLSSTTVELIKLSFFLIFFVKKQKKVILQFYFNVKQIGIHNIFMF